MFRTSDLQPWNQPGPSAGFLSAFFRAGAGLTWSPLPASGGRARFRRHGDLSRAARGGPLPASGWRRRRCDPRAACCRASRQLCVALSPRGWRRPAARGAPSLRGSWRPSGGCGRCRAAWAAGPRRRCTGFAAAAPQARPPARSSNSCRPAPPGPPPRPPSTASARSARRWSSCRATVTSVMARPLLRGLRPLGGGAEVPSLGQRPSLCWTLLCRTGSFLPLHSVEKREILLGLGASLLTPVDAPRSVLSPRWEK